MKLIAVLEEKRAAALAAVCLRDLDQLQGPLLKMAAEKGAGFVDRIGKLVEMVRRPFLSSTDILREGAKNRMLEGLHSLMSAVPKDPELMKHWMTQDTVQTLEKKVTKILDGGAQVVENRIEQSIQPPPGVKAMAEIMKLRDGLKDDGKMPMKFLVPVAGAFGLGALATTEVERMSTDRAHKDNMISIMKDSNIPLGLKPRAKDMYEVLVRYAPSIAKDPVFSKDFTKNLIRHEGVDHKVVSDLISAEKAYQESKGRRAEFLQAMGGIALKAGGL